MAADLIGLSDVAKFTGTPFATVKEEWVGGARGLPIFYKPTGQKTLAKVPLRGLWRYLDPEGKSWQSYAEFRADYLEFKKSQTESGRAQSGKEGDSDE